MPVFFYIVAEFPVEQVPVVLVPLLYSDRQDITMDRITNDPSNIPKGVVSIANESYQIIWGIFQWQTVGKESSDNDAANLRYTDRVFQSF